MPSNGPSAWRLNKAEQKEVDQDVAAFDSSLPAEMAEEEKLLKRAEERKRLTRVIQQGKHEKSLQKQAETATKGKASKASSRMIGKQGASGGTPAGSLETPTSNCNGDYFELLKQDLAVTHKALGNNLKDKLPPPIAAKVDEKSGIQDPRFYNNNMFDARKIRFFNLVSHGQDPYSLDKAMVALASHGVYISSCNLFWLDVWKSPAPGVPLSRARVAQLAEFYFPDSRSHNFFQKLLEVQVDSTALTNKPSGLVMISPLEIVHAVFLKAAVELGDPSATASTKQAWLQALQLA